MLIIKPNELEAVALAAATNAKHYYSNKHYLQGVVFEDYGCGVFAMVATDGHRLHAIGLREKNNTSIDSFILSNEHIRRALAMVKIAKKIMGAKSVKIFLSKKEGCATITVGIGADIHSPSLFGEFSATPIDSTFPDVRQVIPKYENFALGTKYEIYSRYVTGILNAVKLISPVSCTVQIQSGSTYAEPVLFSMPNSTFVGVVMSRRAS